MHRARGGALPGPRRIAVYRVRRLGDIARASAWRLNYSILRLGSLAVVALLLAMIGVYGSSATVFASAHTRSARTAPLVPGFVAGLAPGREVSWERQSSSACSVGDANKIFGDGVTALALLTAGCLASLNYFFEAASACPALRAVFEALAV